MGIVYGCSQGWGVVFAVISMQRAATYILDEGCCMMSV